MKNLKYINPLIVIILVAILISSCTPSNSTVVGEQEIETTKTETEIVITVVEDTPTLEQPLIETIIKPEDTKKPTNTSIPVTSTPTSIPVKTELEASNPDDFQLASGKTQFVEFFAFW